MMERLLCEWEVGLGEAGGRMPQSTRPHHLIFFSRVLRKSTPRFVGWSVCQSVGRSVGWSVTFYFFYEFYFRTSLLLLKWSGDLKYGPCPPARDFGSRVSGLVFFHHQLF